jgi:hypothetical protein
MGVWPHKWVSFSFEHIMRVSLRHPAPAGGTGSLHIKFQCCYFVHEMQAAGWLGYSVDKLRDRKQAAQLRCSSDPSTSAFTTPPAAVLLSTCHKCIQLYTSTVGTGSLACVCSSACS